MKYYNTQDEMVEFNEQFEEIAEDTIACWYRTRILGISASLSSDGNISIPMLKAFDKIAQMERNKCIEIIREDCDIEGSPTGQDDEYNRALFEIANTLQRTR